MNKLALTAGIGAAWAGISIGGYFVVEHQVYDTIETTFETIHEIAPAISSASFETMDIDLLNDKVVIKNSKFQFDAGEFAKRQPMFGLDMEVSGVGEQTQETIIITGVWDLVFGAKEISALSIENAQFTGETVSITKTKRDGKPIDEKQTIQYSGGFASGEVLNFDISSMGEAVTMAPFGVQIGQYVAHDIKMNVDVKIEKPKYEDGDLRAFTDWTQNIETHADISISEMSGQGITSAAIEAIHYNDIAMAMSFPLLDEKSFKSTIGHIGIEDLKFEGNVPTQMKFKVSEFVVDPNDPEAMGLMAAFGIDELNFNFELGYNTNTADNSLKISPILFGLKNAGTIDLNIGLIGVPDYSVFERLQELEAMPQETLEQAFAIQQKTNELMKNAFQELALETVSVGYSDAGVLKKFLGMQALQMKAEPEQLANMFSRQGAMILEATHGVDKAEEAQKILARFLTDPDTLRVKLQAKSPIKVFDLVEQIDAQGPIALQAFDLIIHQGEAAQAH
ncbi:MAG: hypothetical protein OQK24_05990 [Magnetovibrio sp.]|nr:hypothetical protein [Magnetovibrio sp.]